jgi:serine/threonine-protein kinase
LTLGPYVVLHRIGEGGMGQVFKARHSLSGQVFALKVLRPDLAKNPDIAKRFQREIGVSARLAHPNVVRFFDAGQSGDSVYFSMEFVEGADLAKIVREDGPLPPAQACEYIAQAALGLQHAHEHHLIHRDIKPGNLLVSKDGVVKLLDLGLARSLAADAGSYSSTLTQDGMVMGTPDYIAPEQAIDSHTADIRADIYSLGCTFYFILAGQPPFLHGSIMQKLAWQIHAEPPPIEHFRPDLPRELGPILRKMMAKKREERFQTPGEVAAALAPLRPGPVLKRPIEPGGGDPGHRHELWAWVLAGVGCLLLLALGIGIALML